MTLTEKILAKHSGNTRVKPGANIWTEVDKLLTHDVCGPGTFGIFEKEFGKDAQVWDPEKVIIIPDHYIFTSDPRANRNVDILRQVKSSQLHSGRGETLHCRFCPDKCTSSRQTICVCIAELNAHCRDMVKKYGIKYFYDITDRTDFRANPDYKGVCHIAMAQEGHCLPGNRPFPYLGTTCLTTSQHFIVCAFLVMMRHVPLQAQ